MEKCIRFSRSSGRLRDCFGLEETFAEDGVTDLKEAKIWEKRGPGKGCDASTRLLVSPSLNASSSRVGEE